MYSYNRVLLYYSRKRLHSCVYITFCFCMAVDSAEIRVFINRFLLYYNRKCLNTYMYIIFCFCITAESTSAHIITSNLWVPCRVLAVMKLTASERACPWYKDEMWNTTNRSFSGNPSVILTLSSKTPIFQGCRLCDARCSRSPGLEELQTSKPSSCGRQKNVRRKNDCFDHLGVSHPSHIPR